MMTLRIGDKVLWLDDLKADGPREVRVESIELVEKGEKRGILVSAVPWEMVGDHVVVDLDNGRWAYGKDIARGEK